MRVLHVHSGNIWGGIETFMATLARHEHAVSSLRSSFALCFDGEVASRLRDEGSPVHLLAPARLSRPGTVAAARTSLAALLQHAGPDVIALHSSWALAVFAPVLTRAGRPVVAWAHAPDPGPRVERWLAGRARLDLVIANSDFTLRHRPRDRRGVRTERVYYPVSSRPALAARGATRSALGVRGDEPVILIAARLEAWKGHELLLDALSRVGAARPWQCWIAGGPQRDEEREYESSLRARCVRAGLSERVRFLGQRSDIPDLLAAADVYCQPNVGPEPFGISFVEALAAGLPVVSTRIGAAVEIVDDTCGRLSAPHDAAALATTLEDLLASGATRRALGAGGPARAAALCAPASQVRAIERLLVGLLPASLQTVDA